MPKSKQDPPKHFRFFLIHRYCIRWHNSLTYHNVVSYNRELFHFKRVSTSFSFPFCSMSRLCAFQIQCTIIYAWLTLILVPYNVFVMVPQWKAGRICFTNTLYLLTKFLASSLHKYTIKCKYTMYFQMYLLMYLHFMVYLCGDDARNLV